jgi:ABC-type amino acid transport system permease subunit
VRTSPVRNSPAGSVSAGSEASAGRPHIGLRRVVSIPARAGLAFGGSAAVFLGLGALHVYNLAVIGRYIGSGVGPLQLSLFFTSVSFAIGFALAIPLGYLRAFHPSRMMILLAPPSSRLARLTLRLRNAPASAAYHSASGYVAIVRGSPFLVQVLAVYYSVIFSYPHLSILGAGPAIWAGLIALTINTTGYQAEAVRGGFQSVAHGQVEAGRAIGLTEAQIFRRIILPQGLRLVTLPLTNEWISNFKTSTILSLITIYELFSWSRTYIALTLGHPMEGFVMLAIYYLAINVTLSRAVTYLESRMRIPGLGSLPPERLPALIAQSASPTT